MSIFNRIAEDKMVSIISEVIREHQKQWEKNHPGMKYQGMDPQHITEDVNRKLKDISLFWVIFLKIFGLSVLEREERKAKEKHNG